MSTNLTEFSVNVNGLDIAVKAYNSEIDASPVLALHGWLDNAATFDLIAPKLSNIKLITFDLPGHGLSSHRAEGAEYYIWSYVEDVIALADALELEQFALLGHSMGGAIACLISGLYPERVKKLALLDAMGPMSTSATDVFSQMRKALKQKLTQKSRSLHYYPSKQAAIEARAKKGLTTKSAQILAERGVAQSEQGYYWANDRRLNRLNLMSMTEAQVEAFLVEVVCPTCLIAASQSLHNIRERYQQRLAKLSSKCDFSLYQLDGNHHQHLEVEVDNVANLLNRFFI